MIDFTAHETWLGGDFEVAMELAEASSNALRVSLEILWKYPGLSGPYLRRDLAPISQQTERPPLATDVPFYGVAHLPEGDIPCASHAFHFEGSHEAWLSFGFPMTALASRFAVGAFPFVDGTSVSWRDPVQVWLRALAENVHAAAPFKLALIGWEATDSNLTFAAIAADGVPKKRYDGLLVPQGSVLRWFPPTEGASMSIGGA